MNLVHKGKIEPSAAVLIKTYAKLVLFRLCTMSLIRLCRVGGDCSPRRVASLRCFSTMMPSMSSSRAMSVRSGVMGIDSVARRTLVDILKIKNSAGSNLITTEYLVCTVFFKDTSAFPPVSNFYAFLLKGDRADGGCRHGKEHFQTSRRL